MVYKGRIKSPKTKLEVLKRALADAKSELYKKNYIKHHGKAKYNELISELTCNYEIENQK